VLASVLKTYYLRPKTRNRYQFQILYYLFNKIQALSIVCPVNILPNESFPKENKVGLITDSYNELILNIERREADVFLLQITAKSFAFKKYSAPDTDVQRS